MKLPMHKYVLSTLLVLSVCAVCFAQTQISGTAPTTRFATIYQFLGETDGGSSYVRLVSDSTGAMYGTTC